MNRLEKKTIPQLKKILDREMSKWVRRNWSPDGIHCNCFTCGKHMEIRNAHSGHYIPRTQGPTRYDERNQRPQCPGCNTFRSGMPHAFRKNLVAEIGAEEVEDLEALSATSWKWDRFDLIAKIAYYKQALKDME